MRLNKYQLEVLNRGAAIDEQTAAMLKKYTQYKLREFDENILYLSLLDAFNYWAVYFAAGANTADKIKQEQQEQAHKESIELIEKWRAANNAI